MSKAEVGDGAAAGIDTNKNNAMPQSTKRNGIK